MKRWQLSLLHFVLHLHSVLSQQCYYPNGSLSDDVACLSGKDPTWCCASEFPCLSNGLCADIRNGGSKGNSLPGLYDRGSCTDKTWSSPNCVTQCSNPYNGASGVGAQVWACNAELTQYCCDQSPGGFYSNCCDSSEVMFALPSPSLLPTTLASTSTPVSTESTVSMPIATPPSSSSSAPQPTSTSPPKTSNATGLSSGAAAGIGVGVGLAAILGVALIVRWLLRKRRTGRYTREDGVSAETPELDVRSRIAALPEHEPKELGGTAVSELEGSSQTHRPGAL